MGENLGGQAIWGGSESGMMVCWIGLEMVEGLVEMVEVLVLVVEVLVEISGVRVEIRLVVESDGLGISFVWQSGKISELA